ncbi:MAG TPA: hypothetical protein VIJ14_08705 [Rhabdochlamydiaceae bacterium]
MIVLLLSNSLEVIGEVTVVMKDSLVLKNPFIIDRMPSDGEFFLDDAVPYADAKMIVIENQAIVGRGIPGKDFVDLYQRICEEEGRDLSDEDDTDIEMNLISPMDMKKKKKEEKKTITTEECGNEISGTKIFDIGVSPK